VIGGANSAGQAALHLAKFAARATLLLRGPTLALCMSDHLITQREATHNVDVRLHTRVVDGHGDARLRAITVQDVETGNREQLPVAALFVMIGAEPRADGRREILALEEHGFILTGRDIPSQRWPLARAPLPFETSLP